MQETRENKPSTVFHGDLYTVRVYTDESTDPHVYDLVKHVWWKNRGNVLVILHYMEDNSHRYVHWLASRIVWYQVTPMRFEKQRQENELHIDRR